MVQADRDKQEFARRDQKAYKKNSSKAARAPIEFYSIKPMLPPFSSSNNTLMGPHYSNHNSVTCASTQPPLFGYFSSFFFGL